MTIRAVLLDFSGTLFRLTDQEHWLTHVGADIPLHEQAELLQKMTAPVRPSSELSAQWQELWERRDLDPDIHRQVYAEVLRRSGLPHDVAESIYDGLITPKFWEPYPDTEATLQTLRDNGIPVAVVSNIAWDITEAFAEHGILDLVDEYVLSYVEGSVKPEHRIFHIACERLGVDPADTLMVGDSEEADGAAAELGARVAIVAPLPVAQRPHALLDVLAAHGISPRSPG